MPFHIGLSNVSLQLVRAVEERFAQTESNATVEVGVAIGVFMSVCILAALYAASRRRAPAISEADAPAPSGACAVEESPKGADAESGADGAVGTEGCYRSDSDSDDEGRGVKICKEAQRRSRASHGV